MKKTFELEDLDCANCAMKMQEAILKIRTFSDFMVFSVMYTFSQDPKVTSKI